MPPPPPARPTLDELLAKITVIALDLLPDNHPSVTPEQVLMQLTALRKAIVSDDRDRTERCDVMAAQAKSIQAVWSNPNDKIWDSL
jgi:hypothetical protein